MELILSIIIVYLLWLVIKPFFVAYAQRKYRQKVNDMFNQAFGGGQNTGGNTRTGTHTGGNKRRKKKIFSRDEGEYIEFEEIKCSKDEDSRQPNNTSSASDSKSAYTPREPQVSDADWEEIR